MTHHERATLADRCARCDASTGAPDANALLGEARAQLEEARRERDAMCGELALARDSVSRLARERDAMRAAADSAGVRIAEMRAELIDVRSEAAGFANAIGRIESVLGMAGAGLLCKTVRAVDDVVKQLADARLSAEQGVRVAEALAAEKAALVERVGVLSAALRGLRSDLDRVLAMRSTLGRTEWLTIIADKARAALEVEP